MHRKLLDDAVTSLARDALDGRLREGGKYRALVCVLIGVERGHQILQEHHRGMGSVLERALLQKS